MKPFFAAVGCGHVDVVPVRARLWAAWTERGLSCLQWAAAEASATDIFGSAHPAVTEIPEPYGGVLRSYLAGEDVGERIGQPIGMADPIIAAIALQHVLELVTGNTAHFQRVQQLGYPLVLANRRI